MVYRNQSRKRSSRKRLFAAAAVLLLLVALGGFALFRSQHHASTSSVAPSGPQTKGERLLPADGTSTSNGKPGSTTSTSGADQDKAGPAGGTTNTTLITPTGTFVSNHHPNLSGQPAPNRMASNCTSTPGASCQITFTMGGTTKSLPTKTTDAQGTAYWQDWTLQSIGLTEGTWTIKAVATLSGSSSSASDGQGLVVAP
jgi:hypothetical protein